MGTITSKLFGNKEDDADRESIRKVRAKRLTYIIAVTVALLVLAGYSVTISSTTITPLQVYETFINQI
ncbi:MAG: hypothetical protein LBU30_04210, partial [Candidatus Methanoplasma sp.]|nr:hypothetical protein [Candidatus Methanoplasma sp.]